MNETIYQGEFDDYMEKARDLADEKQMPVLVDMPYDRKYFVMPIEPTKQG